MLDTDKSDLGKPFVEKFVVTIVPDIRTETESNGFLRNNGCFRQLVEQNVVSSLVSLKYELNNNSYTLYQVNNNDDRFLKI